MVVFARDAVDVSSAAGYDLVRTAQSSGDYDVVLAHRRLAIVDPKGGVQPMCNEDGTIWLTYNGEIYNFQSIRRELLSAGHRFVTDHSDTEVIIHAWEEWGEACLERFNGMFAFALYDSNRHAIFLARDRVGKKPLYFRYKPGLFQFASEIGALSSAREIEPRALNFFLAMGFVPGRLSIYSDVAKLPPAHAALLDLRDWKLREWRYWSLPRPLEGECPKEEELVDELDALLFDAVSLRLISDVPLGVFLSGGVDSSLVAAMAARACGQGLRTFTVALPGAGRYDESSFAYAVAKHLDTDHTELSSSDDALDLLPLVLPSMGEPLGDSSLLPTWQVAQLSRRHVTVALGGDGGDELFAGYRHYLSIPEATQRFACVPGVAWAVLARMAECLPVGVRGRNLLYSMRESPRASSVWGTTFFTPGRRRALLHDGARQLLKGVWEEPEQWRLSLMQGDGDLVDRLTRMDFCSYLPDDIMVKVDRASMLNSLEVRAPWLDHRLVEFAFGRVPTAMKVRNGTGKWLSKRLASRLLPKGFNFERKQGFSVPLDRWLSANIDKISGLVSDVHPWLRSTEVNSLLAGETKGRANGARLFALMSLKYSLSPIGVPPAATGA